MAIDRRIRHREDGVSVIAPWIVVVADLALVEVDCTFVVVETAFLSSEGRGSELVQKESGLPDRDI